VRPFRAVFAAFAVLLAPASALAGTGPERLARYGGTVAVAYESEAALRSALAQHPARVVRRLPALRVAEVRPDGSTTGFVAGVRVLPGIESVEAPRPRANSGEPSLALRPSAAAPLQWQHAATRSNTVPEWALRAASAITIAVIDTGADLGAPDIAAKAPGALDLASGSVDVEDEHGHGTFVASLAAGSVTNGEGMAGAGGDARLLVIRVGGDRGRFTDVDEARAITAATDRGAKIINISFGGTVASTAERRAIEYATARGILIVAPVGNEFGRGNPVEYPAALLQPVGSRGVGGTGLAVAASTVAGGRASFSNTGTWVSLAAPGTDVFGAVSSLSAPAAFPRVELPGSSAGFYGFGSGSSFAAPQVAGAAAIVWGANPSLTAAQVAQILKETAQGGGRWNSQLGYGVIDVAAAVARATGAAPAPERDAVGEQPRLLLATAAATARARSRVAITATLEHAAAAQPEIVLERRGVHGWREVGRAVADASGHATWRLSLGPGRHELRARFGALTSRSVLVAIRR
jgi:subtilisin family serine protease